MAERKVRVQIRKDDGELLVDYITAEVDDYRIDIPKLDVGQYTITVETVAPKGEQAK